MSDDLLDVLRSLRDGDTIEAHWSHGKSKIIVTGDVHVVENELPYKMATLNFMGQSWQLFDQGMAPPWLTHVRVVERAPELVFPYGDDVLAVVTFDGTLWRRGGVPMKRSNEYFTSTRPGFRESLYWEDLIRNHGPITILKAYETVSLMDCLRNAIKQGGK
ncbi:MAG: hypothetical protein EBU08_14615 [Micrococcales bacterium]|nr:hypothetical protein [Micrococcales bacterium]